MGVNTTVIGRGTIQVTLDATFDTPWDIMDEGFPLGIKLGAIKFYGSAANDILLVRDGSATGPVICKMKDVTPSGVADAFDGTVVRPYLEVVDQVFGTAANVIIIFEYL
jgi:hypothetical protein